MTTNQIQTGMGAPVIQSKTQFAKPSKEGTGADKMNHDDNASVESSSVNDVQIQSPPDEAETGGSEDAAAQ